MQMAVLGIAIVGLLFVVMILLGEAFWLRSGGLVIYWAGFFLAANLFVIGYEEPYLRRQFGASYTEYTRRVGRWIPRVTSSEKEQPS